MRLAAIAVPVSLCAVLTLAACGPGAPVAEETDAPKPTISATPTATPTPEPEPAPEAFAATCENLLSTSLAEYSGIGIYGPGDYADKLEDEGNPAYAFYEAGGVFCFVGEQEAYALYGWAPFDDAGWEPFRQSLLDEDWSEDVTDAGFLLRTPYPQPLQVCYYRPDQFGACAVSDDVLDEIIANAGA